MLSTTAEAPAPAGRPAAKLGSGATSTAGAGDHTLPIWIFTNLTRPNQAPVVNVVAVVLTCSR
jgi:hypothetical protein